MRCPHCCGSGELVRSTVGELIKTVRQSLDMSQAALAAAAEFDPAHICRIEAGATQPSLTALTKIAEALECPMKDLTP